MKEIDTNGRISDIKISAGQLLGRLDINSIFYTEILNLLGGSVEYNITTISDFDNILSKINDYLLKRCEEVNPTYILPILLQCYNECYYGSANDKIIFGPSIKVMMSIIWNNNWNDESKFQQTISNSVEILKLCYMFDQIKNNRFYYKTMYNELKNKELKLSKYGISGKSEFNGVVDIFSSFFEKRGELFRLSNGLFFKLSENIIESIQCIKQVINGKNPCNIKMFDNTILSEIPYIKYKEFWGKLYARLALELIYFKNVKGNSTDLESCIGILESKHLLPSNMNKTILYKYINELIWSKDWFKKRSDIPLSEKISERPIIPIANKFFITSFPAMGDSFNWFIESSVMEYPDSDGVKLPQKLFEKYVSNKFEGEVNNFLRQKGFISGTVTNKETWITGEYDVKLDEINNNQIPGQIDALAYNKELNIIFILECKVLLLPTTTNRLNNIINKLGKSDEEQFHAKLSKKTEWIRNTKYFHSMDCKIYSFIILDKMLPNKFDGQFPVIDVGSLKKEINKIIT